MSSPALLAPLILPLATKDWLAPSATVLAALVAITGVIISTVIQRRTGRETTAAAKRSADAAELSAASSDRSSKAAQASVDVNERIGEAVGKRATADALAKRYQDAATQLGHDKAPVRLAGVYAMARLADDWEEQRQQCVDVLCAYLRMPTHEGTDVAGKGEDEVRTSIIRLIGDHLVEEQVINWCDCHFDLSYAVLGSVVWQNPTFNRSPDFHGARFTSLVSVSSPHFRRGANFMDARFEQRFETQSARVDEEGLYWLFVLQVGAGVTRRWSWLR